MNAEWFIIHHYSFIVHHYPFIIRDNTEGVRSCECTPLFNFKNLKFLIAILF